MNLYSELNVEVEHRSQLLLPLLQTTKVQGIKLVTKTIKRTLKLWHNLQPSLKRVHLKEDQLRTIWAIPIWGNITAPWGECVDSKYIAPDSLFGGTAIMKYFKAQNFWSLWDFISRRPTPNWLDEQNWPQMWAKEILEGVFMEQQVYSIHKVIYNMVTRLNTFTNQAPHYIPSTGPFDEDI